MALSGEAGWNQNEGDWKFLLQHGHSYGIEVAGKGLVATTGAWSMGADFAWINMVLVTETCRGMGFAKLMLKQCLADTKSRGQIALLDATDQGLRVYEKMGFEGGKGLVRLKRVGEDGKSPRPEPIETGWSVRMMEESDLERVQSMDAKVFGADRKLLLADLKERCPQSAWVLRDSTGAMRGFMMGRGGRAARQLGPLVVENVKHARALVTRVLHQVKGPIYMDVPEEHLAWMGELSRWGFRPERRFTRMGERGVTLATDWTCYYALAGPDFA